MSSYIIKFKNTSSEEGTIIADVGFNYSDKLNAVNEANIKISGSSETKRSLIEIGSEVYIYRNGTLEFHGPSDSVDYLDGGGMSVHVSGHEKWLVLENGDYASSPWTATASATIFTSIIGESSEFTAGTINAGTSIDFQSEKTESIWNAISNLRQKTQQDIQIDYTNSEVDILDHKGSSTSVATFNAGIQIGNIRVSQSYPLGNDVRVYGASEGETRIISNILTAGQDVASKATYGTIRKIVRDPSILTQAEANKLADALVAMYKDPIKIYDFEVLNPNQSLISGDVITLNAKSQNLSNEEVRIVGIEKGVSGGQEYLTLQVTNKEYGQLVKTRNELMADIEKNARDNQTYNQYQGEYTNSNCATCIGGSSYVCGNCYNFGGKLYGNGIDTCLCGIFNTYFGNQHLDFNSGMTVCADKIQAGTHAGVSTCWSIFSDGIDMCGACIINQGNASGGLFVDTTNPYICPCNSCNICVSCLVANNCLSSGAVGIGMTSACQFAVSGNSYFSGCAVVTYVDGTCVCGSRKLKIPVGTNCY